MKKFLVVFYDGSEVVVEGFRVYSDLEYYYIDEGDNNEKLRACYWEKISVKCITPLKPTH